MLADRILLHISPVPRHTGKGERLRCDAVWCGNGNAVCGAAGSDAACGIWPCVRECQYAAVQVRELSRPTINVPPPVP